jgi:hypothetical protein
MAQYSEGRVLGARAQGAMCPFSHVHPVLELGHGYHLRVLGSAGQLISGFCAINVRAALPPLSASGGL